MKCPAVISVLLLHYSSAFNMKDALSECLKDEDYNELLNIVKNGLPQTKHHHRVVIVGAGMAGMTAAKLLEDAGHQVRSMGHHLLLTSVFSVETMHFVSLGPT